MIMPRDRQDLVELVREFDTAMLVTETPEGALRARPMAIARVEDQGDMWFVTSSDSPKVEEIRGHHAVNVTLQGKNRFLSLSGQAWIVRDRAKIDELWSKAYEPYFPQGKDSPDLVLIRVQADHGEYWDFSGAQRLRYLYEAGKAWIRQQELDTSQLSHKKVQL